MPNIAERTASTGKNHAAANTQYARLLAAFSPVAIESDTEHDRALKAAAALMDKDKRSSAETSLLKLLAVLVEDYEQKRYSMGDADPVEALKELMRAREWKAKDLWTVFGSKGITSEVLNGKRRISNEAARKLGELFSVSPSVFIRMNPMQPEIDAIRKKRKDIDDGVSLRLAPGYRVPVTLSASGSRTIYSIRVIRNNVPLTLGEILIRGVSATAPADVVASAVIATLSSQWPGSLKKLYQLD